MAGTGACLGAVAALGLNQFLMSHFETTRLPPISALMGMLILMLVSLLSALIPSIRASNVAPVVAIRTA
jgi:putative ABC transport system permease protein